MESRQLLQERAAGQTPRRHCPVKARFGRWTCAVIHLGPTVQERTAGHFP